MALYIHQMNVRSWVNLVLSTLHSVILRTTVRRLNSRKVCKTAENNSIVQHAVDEIILQEKEKLNVKYETYENIDYQD